MNKPLYLVSLYYRADVRSGANKRLECLFNALQSRSDVAVSVLIPASEVHGFAGSEARIVPIPIGGTRGVARFVGWFRLVQKLRSLAPGVVVSDLMPPLSDACGHEVHQLVHDVRALDGYRAGARHSRLTALQYSLMLRRTARIITVSRASAERIAEAHGAARISVVPNGLSEEYFQPVNRGPRRYDVLCIGIFEARKNYERAVRAISALVTAGMPLRCLFIGADGGERSRIIELIEKLHLAENISVASQIKDESRFVARTYDQAKVFLAPSLYEGFGMPLIEAAARGCRIACSAIKPFQEIDPQGAHYFDARSVESMRAGLSAALNDESRPDDTLRHRYSWDSVADKLLRALDGC